MHIHVYASVYGYVLYRHAYYIATPTDCAHLHCLHSLLEIDSQKLDNVGVTHLTE